ncbi:MULTISPECIES: efflux RND transporter periplasmic adaptor subunit [unclassified Flavobacterium]|uniref:efflux RND transporter periplasmic adaptor subunit n=1 Tax=unclassified Flavobacterium TaxID=196869 RepID=UPI00086B621B|nr:MULTISPECIES: efflux RND transporter periplasmic adaptor subunit [unclassified Flavobacterium]MBN9285284.1 efflux RND transporter periplasmic adaptor subunit [Flavobacterium sp.]ODS83317.1 MAG: efflux transporter periplasmic adaptor subunit [Chryseobacterium sp. SCN 40-13]OJV72000.1 MAG: efflux transporter periplasmic adaptor subunit [Flavobacterium sp. 40-81]
MRLLILSLTSLLVFACGNKTENTAMPAPELPVISINANNAVTSSEYPASIQGMTNVEIRPQVAGNLEKVFVDEGAFVSKGQLLFKINEQPFREQLNNALASLHAAEAAVINAQLEVDKLTPLVQNKVVSDYQLKAAKAGYKIAVANVNQAKAMVGSAEINLGYTSIKAPVSGYLGRLPKKQGSLVGPADVEALTQLSDVHEVHVYFSLGESDFIAFKSQHAGNSINEKINNLPPVTLVLADNSDYSEKGRIDMVDGQFDKNTGAITLRASFPNAKGLLRSGNTGKIKLDMKHSDALLIPQEATMEVQDKIYVFTVDKTNKVSKQPIVVAGKSGTDYLVTNGIKSGDRIVFKGFENLQEGTVINPEKAKKAIAQK